MTYNDRLVYCASCDVYTSDYFCDLCRQDKEHSPSFFLCKDPGNKYELEIGPKFSQVAQFHLDDDPSVFITIVHKDMVNDFKRYSDFRPASVYPSRVLKLPHEVGHMGRFRILYTNRIHPSDGPMMYFMRVPWRIVEEYRCEWEERPERGLMEHIEQFGLRLSVKRSLRAKRLNAKSA